MLPFVSPLCYIVWRRLDKISIAAGAYPSWVRLQRSKYCVSWDYLQAQTDTDILRDELRPRQKTCVVRNECPACGRVMFPSKYLLSMQSDVECYCPCLHLNINCLMVESLKHLVVFSVAF